jgi:hypothetical protein
VQRKLKLHENVGCRSLPWHASALKRAVAAIEKQHPNTHAARSVIVAGIKEADRIEPMQTAVERVACRFGPSPFARLGARYVDRLWKRKCRRDWFVECGGCAVIKRIWRQRR